MAEGWRVHLVASGILLAAILLALWPPPLGEAVIGHPLSDVADHVQGAWWWGGEILSGHLPLHTSISHLPEGGDLWYVDPVGALLALPFRCLGMARAWDLSLVLSLLLGGLAVHALAWRWTGRLGPSVVAALPVILGPYAMGLLHSGLSEFVGFLFPVLFLGVLLECVDAPRWKAAMPWAAAGGLLLALCTLQSFYYGLFACLVVPCFLAGRDLRGRAARLGPLLGLGLLLALPILLVAGASLSGQGAVSEETAPSWRQAMLPALDPTLFLWPARRYFPDTPALGNPGILQIHALGWLPFLLGLAGLALHPRARRHLPAVLVLLVLCLGPAAAWMGSVPPGGGPTLPLGLLYRIPHSPLIWIHHPYRLVAFFLPFLGLGLALLLSRTRAWVSPLVGAMVLAESLLLSPSVWPLPRASLAIPPVYARLEAPGGVLDWPPDATDWNRRYELYQVTHARPIAYGVNVFLSSEIRRDPLGFALFAALEDPLARARNRDVPGRLERVRPPAEGPSGLGGLGFAYLVVHEAAMGPRERERTLWILDCWLGPAPFVEAQARAWPLPQRVDAPVSCPPE